jgi:excisionase family DNA binding protein
MGIGNLMGQALQGGMQGGAAGAGGAKMADIMTPLDAANVMKVNESDILDAIKEGTLKAKKVGKQYRITKEALDEFMNS